VLDESAGSTIGTDIIDAIRGSSLPVQIVLANGLVITIDPALIGANAREIDLNIAITAESGRIVIAPPTHGDYGFTISFDVPADGLTGDAVDLFHADSSGNVTFVQTLPRNADGTVTVSISGASHYFLTETASMNVQNNVGGDGVSLGNVDTSLNTGVQVGDSQGNTVTLSDLANLTLFVLDSNQELSDILELLGDSEGVGDIVNAIELLMSRLEEDDFDLSNTSIIGFDITLEYGGTNIIDLGDDTVSLTFAVPPELNQESMRLLFFGIHRNADGTYEFVLVSDNLIVDSFGNVTVNLSLFSNYFLVAAPRSDSSRVHTNSGENTSNPGSRPPERDDDLADPGDDLPLPPPPSGGTVPPPPNRPASGSGTPSRVHQVAPPVVQDNADVGTPHVPDTSGDVDFVPPVVPLPDGSDTQGREQVQNTEVAEVVPLNPTATATATESDSDSSVLPIVAGSVAGVGALGGVVFALKKKSRRAK
jgi:hypothetical protein